MRDAEEKAKIGRAAAVVAAACLALCGFGGSAPLAEGAGPTEIECAGDACQPLPPEPEDPMPGTLGDGPTNPPVKAAGGSKKKKPKKHHRHRRRHA